MIIDTILVIIVLFITWSLYGCAPYQTTYGGMTQSQLQQFAESCNNGYPSSCIVVQQAFEDRRAQSFYDQNARIAERQHWQNYWLAQQRESDQIYTDATNQLNFSRSQLMQH